MILYFSATGNCEYVAGTIAKAIGDTAVDFADANSILELADAEVLGIVAPTYHWGLPSIVNEYLKGIEIKANGNYVFFVSTYGTSCGQSGFYMSRTLESKTIWLDASFSVKMPDNWTPMFDLSDPEKVAAINKAEIPQIEAVIEHVQKREHGDFMKHKLPLFLCNAAKFFSQNASKTSHLHLEENCMGCGLCENKCPVQAIKMENGKPVWVKKRCAMCLGCLHRCPKFAIQYGSCTQRHGQYRHPKELS